MKNNILYATLFAFLNSYSLNNDQINPASSLAIATVAMPGGFINLGAFGGTPYASRSKWPLEWDLNYDFNVTIDDLYILIENWTRVQGRLEEILWPVELY